MVTTIAELSKKVVGMSPAAFASAHPAPALVLLLSSMSRVESSLHGDLPEDGLMFTDIFFFRRELALDETSVGDPWHSGSFRLLAESPLLFIKAAEESPE